MARPGGNMRHAPLDGSTGRRSARGAAPQGRGGAIIRSQGGG